MLRDKLHITTAQLAEATSHVRELETEKREVWERMIPSVSQSLESEKLREALATSGIRVAEYFLYKLILQTEKREKESTANILSLQERSIALLAQSAELEAK